jgi:hypothetical protein
VTERERQIDRYRESERREREKKKDENRLFKFVSLVAELVGFIDQ